MDLVKGLGSLCGGYAKLDSQIQRLSREVEKSAKTNELRGSQCLCIDCEGDSEGTVVQLQLQTEHVCALASSPYWLCGMLSWAITYLLPKQHNSLTLSLDIVDCISPPHQPT